MIVGFSGTRDGMTPQQRKIVARMLAELESGSVIHHGDCVGSDDQAHEIAHLLGIFTSVHPPVVEKYRAWNQGNVRYGEKDYLERNRDIVAAAEVVWATPKETWHKAGMDALAGRTFKGGTWYTIRYAKKQGKPVTIIYADGVVGE